VGNSKLIAVEEKDRAADRIAFFESKIRPALIQYCYECHSQSTETNGGLTLDSKRGWEQGGDSGTAIIAGHPDKSRLIKAIRYEIPKLQMPPDGRMPKELVEAFEKWVADGANDPRDEQTSHARKDSGLTVERAHEHWAYRPLDLSKTHSDEVGNPTETVDRLIDAALKTNDLNTAGRASPMAIVRRLYFDLTGLPPSAQELSDWIGPAGDRPLDVAALVDHLLNSPRFGEHFARKWLDVVRYAESVTLRGLVLPNAWRYRDYVIDSFNADRPFDQMIREQIAGDLMSHNDENQRRWQLIATGFLALGNTNLEEQDKSQLDMDYIDEQLEVIGNAFLGQTIGCARCHNHKFDPIPTKDYYALAGILKSAVGMEHENVSKWIDQPLPLPKEERSKYEAIANELADINRRIADLKKASGKVSKEAKLRTDPSRLPGVIIDNTSAKLVGSWMVSSAIAPTVGADYIHDGNEQQGTKTATFEPPNLTPGAYEVRFAYAPHNNRATNAKVRIFSADGESTVVVNQQVPAPEDSLWISLGKYRFEKDGQSFVMVTNEGANGVVIADAVQFLPIAETILKDDPKKSSVSTATTSVPIESAKEDPQSIAKEKELKELESSKKSLEARLSDRPMYLTILEKGPAADIPVHIRGDVHNLGEIVPRGFLTAVGNAGVAMENAPSRMELAQWISSPSNPLTARVYANRIWSWMMGQGIVASSNNFGTTGSSPTHPELLDWLARELIEHSWSTKHLVKVIALSRAYQRAVSQPDDRQQQIDPSNTLCWRGNMRRLPAEALRDSMLLISGELEESVGGSVMRANTKADYNYRHDSNRRSVYQTLFRNSLPELFDAFDFADTSMSIGQRPRTTVATQALTLANSPWVIARAKSAAKKYEKMRSTSNSDLMLAQLFLDCFGRFPEPSEKEACLEFLSESGSSTTIDSEVQDEAATARVNQLQMLIHGLFTSLDFRYLD
jgi:hypothetical protein